MKAVLNNSPIKGLKVNVHSRDGFTMEEIQKHETAMGMLEQVVSSVQFRERVLTTKLVRTNGMTNVQVYELIMSGAETLGTDGADHEIDLYLEMYSARGKVVGYTRPDTIKEWLNRNFFSGFGYPEICDNAFHEWLHKLGFDHISAKDYDSVPYALGYLVEQMVKELMAGSKFTPVGTIWDQDRPNDVPVIVPPVFKKVLVCRRTWRSWFRKTCTWEAP
jgi:hypothetical protein